MYLRRRRFYLRREMTSRHLYMIALGGVIGAGFFNGSGMTINQAGPLGAIIAYLLGGLSMCLIMLCLGELTVAMPVVGSFQDYATRFINPATGFTVGWLYFIGWSVVITFELITIGKLFQRWFPDSSIWLWCSIFGLILLLINASAVRVFGEVEYWFTNIKVMAIIFFIVVGGAAIFGLVPLQEGEHVSFLSQVTEDGLFPNGISVVLLTLLAVNFSYLGVELIGIAAGESEYPEKTVPKAIKNTIVSTILLYIFGIAVLIALIPWREAGVAKSPFVFVMDKIGIPYAADIMNFVIIVALLSVANSGLFAASRMLYSLSKNGMAPVRFQKLSDKGIPLTALLATFLISMLSMLAFLFNQSIYLWLLALAGMTGVLAWMSIAASQFFFRRRYLAGGGIASDLLFRTPFYPLTPILAFVLNFLAFLSLAFNEETSMSLYIGIPVIVGCYLYYYSFLHHRHKDNGLQNVTISTK